NLSQNVVHSDSDLILHNSSVLIDKEPLFILLCFYLKLFKMAADIIYCATDCFNLFSVFI
ncbi:hypothetical protein EWU44_04030, partial [Enterococcus faecium]